MTEIVISSIILTLLGMLGPFYFKYLIDEVFIGGLLESLHVVTIGISLFGHIINNVIIFVIYII